MEWSHSMLRTWFCTSSDLFCKHVRSINLFILNLKISWELAKPFQELVCTKSVKNRMKLVNMRQGCLLKKGDPHYLAIVNNFSRCHKFLFLGHLSHSVTQLGHSGDVCNWSLSVIVHHSLCINNFWLLISSWKLQRQLLPFCCEAFLWFKEYKLRNSWLYHPRSS